MSLHRVSGWVAECDKCSHDITEYVCTKAAALAEIEDSDAFRYGALVICWRCLSRRACRIFGHKGRRSAACHQIHCDRCREIVR